jgi:hypothetical protein
MKIVSSLSIILYFPVHRTDIAITFIFLRFTAATYK